MPKFPKGSQEAKDYMKSLRDKRGTKPKDPNAPKKLTKRQKELSETVDIPIMSSSTLILPEYFATPIKNDKYKLVNPMSQERNLSKRNGKLSLKLVRKPVENMILLEGNDDPIPLAKFSKQDRIIIDNHFQLVDKYKEKEPKDVPTIYHSKPLERGRPETLPKNIQINKEKGKTTKKTTKNPTKNPEPIITPIVEQPEYELPVEQPNIQMTIQELKKKGRPTKYATDEEKAKNKRIQTLESNKKKRAEKKALKEQAKQQQGTGILEQVKHFVFGNEGLPTKTKNMLKKYGNEKIQSIYLIRTPVPKYLTELLNVASLGEFNKNIKEANYDKLFHLAIVFKTSKGEVLLEKNENINMTESIPKVEGTETQNLNLSQDITINEVLERTKKYMGNDKFLKYDASTNNCQDFILSILKANGLGNKTDETFVKQDIESLFKSSPYLKPLTKNILDIANRFTGTGMTNYKVQSVIFDKDKYTLKSAKDWLKTNGYKQPKVDETEDNLRFRQKDPDVLESRGFTEYRTKPLGKSGIQLIIAYYKSDISGRGGGNTTMRESDSDFDSVLYSQPPTDILNSEYFGEREVNRKLKRLLNAQDEALFYLAMRGDDAKEKEEKRDIAFEYLRQKGENAITLTPEEILAMKFDEAGKKKKVINGKGNAPIYPEEKPDYSFNPVYAKAVEKKRELEDEYDDLSNELLDLNENRQAEYKKDFQRFIETVSPNPQMLKIWDAKDKIYVKKANELREKKDKVRAKWESVKRYIKYFGDSIR